LAKAVLGQPLRQASHFVELAAIGARLCVGAHGGPLPSDTGVYVATGLGEIRKTEALFDQVKPPALGLATPFDFINATPNMAAFHVARLLGLQARNFTVTQGVLSFEWALTLAAFDLMENRNPAVLVGGVDENYFPRRDYLRHWELREGKWASEGSAWWWLSRDPKDAKAELLFVTRLATAGFSTDAWGVAVAAELSHQPRSLSELNPIAASALAVSEQEKLKEIFAPARVDTLANFTGTYPTACALALTFWLERSSALKDGCVHISRAPGADTMLVGLKRL
jgi:hypothetical protein